ncbi:MAG: polysaccharide deacetylase [Lachnospiraceae bacterium]|nr:polysaccharide deacetylase [Lachnospiraceae bacterium]
MEKIQMEESPKQNRRTEADRRRRIKRYKTLLLGGLLLGTICPIVISLILLHKVSILEEKVQTYQDTIMADWVTIQSSGEALMSNPNVKLNDLNGEPDGMAGGVIPTGDPAAFKDQSGLFSDGKNAGFDTDVKTNRVYLTFDDGPSIYTGQILDILDANDVKATFFVLAKEDEPYVSYYQEILDRGHTLGMHSYTHDYTQIYASLDAFEKDVTDLSDFLYDQTGVKPTIYRFPGGSSNNAGQVSMQECIAYLNEQGIQYYDWNALNGDAVSTELSAQQLVDNIMRGVHKNNTSIILMHDMQSRHTTVDSLQPLIDTLKSEGYELLPIDETTPLIQHIPYDTGFEEAAD